MPGSYPLRTTSSRRPPVPCPCLVCYTLMSPVFSFTSHATTVITQFIVCLVDCHLPTRMSVEETMSTCIISLWGVLEYNEPPSMLECINTYDLNLGFVCVCVCVCVCVLSHVPLFATPWTIVHQVPLSMEFSRQEYWSRLPFPGDLPDPMIEPASLMPHELTREFFTTVSPAAAAAKSLQSCLTLCDLIDCSSPGSTVPGILQARTLEWVAMSFSNA